MMYYRTAHHNRVWHYDQAEHRQGDRPGYCAGMVTFWIMMRAHGGDFDTYMGRGDIVEARLSNEQMQTILQHQDVTLGEEGMGGYNDLLKTDGFKFRKKHTQRVGADDGGAFEDIDLESVADYVAQQSRNAPTINTNQGVRATWFLVRMRPPKPRGGSGHVAAIEVRTDSEGQQVYRLMDPSNGCFEFYTRTTFKKWLMERFFYEYRHIYTGYVKIVKVSRLDPPPLSKFTNKVKSVLKSIFK